MLTPIRDTDILKRFSKPPETPPEPSKPKNGGITTFPSVALDLPVDSFKKALARREENRKELIAWIKRNLEDQVDYGRIHIVEHCRYARAGSPHLCRDISHYSRPQLWRAGAEKIIHALNLTVHFPNANIYEMACSHKQELSSVMLKCELWNPGGTVVAEGVGAANVRDNNYNLNKSIKMCAKAAMIDAVLRVAGLSSVFTKTNRHTLTSLGVCRDRLPGGSDCNEKHFLGGADCNSQPEKPVTRKQLQLIQYLAGRKGYTTDSLDKHCQDLFGKSLSDLDKVQAHKIINQFINNG